MTTFQSLMDEAGLTISDLARRSGIAYRTCRKAVRNEGSIQRVKILAMLKILNTALGTQYTLSDLSDIQIR